MLFTRTPTITPQEAADRLEAGSLVVVDVREPAEVGQARIPGAVTIPLGQLPTRLGELDAGTPVAFVCRSGARSAQATKAAAKAGLDAANVRGGIMAWSRAGLRIVGG